ncbi:MAG TPA: Gfo/Idh/MocA family oxidoreductase [Roseiarcus sp.]|nr:Gfo/Idh/MocA family oxidoreductase [Roseiarcus sp.]
MPKIGIGVIGCGDIARARYFPAIGGSAEFELRGLQSRTPAICEPIVKQYGGKIYPHLDALLRALEIEAVVISTPHPSHAELSIRCLEAGKHVLSEKPMATSLADARRIFEAAEKSRRVYMALPFDENPPVEEAKRLIEAGAIGRVTSADAVLAHQGPQHAPWFFDRDKAEWGVLADLGVYLISQLTYLFGPAEQVLGRVNTAIPDRTSAAGEPIKVTVDDNVAMALEWPSRILATIRANWCSPSDHRNVICETRIYGTTGMIFVNLASKTNPIVVFLPKAAIEGATPIEYNNMSNCYRPALAPWDGDAEIMRSFAAQIASGRLVSANGSNASRQRHVIEIIDKTYAASASGSAQKLETR